jgi:hypothetical protein
MPRKTLTKAAVPAGTFVAGGQGQLALVGEYAEAVLVVDVTAISGTNTALAFVIMVGDETLGVLWRRLAGAHTLTKASDGSAVTSLIATGRYLLALAAPIGAVLRADFTLASDTTPSVTFRADWLLKD